MKNLRCTRMMCRAFETEREDGASPTLTALDSSSPRASWEPPLASVGPRSCGNSSGPKGTSPVLAPCFLPPFQCCLAVQGAQSHGPWPRCKGCGVLSSVDEDRLAQSSGYSPVIAGHDAALKGHARPREATRSKLFEGPGGSGRQNPLRNLRCPVQNENMGSLFRN